MSNSTNDFIGKHYELLKIDGSIMVRIKINYCKIEEKVRFDDILNRNVTKEIVDVSESGYAWFQFVGGNYDRIV